MKCSFSAIGCLLAAAASFCLQHVEAGFSNPGRMESKHLNIDIHGTLDNNGELIGRESATISCDTISGKGLIQAPEISLTTKIFAFTGTIECSEKCTIVTSASFDEKMFENTGEGEFIIVVDENSEEGGEEKPTLKSLAAHDIITDGLEVQD
ncbi:MAG: hypothetical protein WB791_00870 [Waddliaceae bacterium]